MEKFTSDSSDQSIDKNSAHRKISAYDATEEKIKTADNKMKQSNPSNWRMDKKALKEESKKTKITQQLRITNKIDFISFLLFNFTYLFFNFIYWAKYLK